MDAAGDETRDVKLFGVYEDEDLVLLEIQGAPLTPVKWSFETPKLGSFLAAPQPDGRLAAFGVVSVPGTESARKRTWPISVWIGDPEFTGQGVRVSGVADDSGAQAAGLKPGNVILKVGERPISGSAGTQKRPNRRRSPEQKIPCSSKWTGKKKRSVSCWETARKCRNTSEDGLEQMERMGGPISQVRDSFTHVIQTDMRPKPNQIGGPVVDLKGRVVGITMARADRTRSFVMPASAVVELLKKEAGNPAIAQVRGLDEDAPLATRGNPPPNMVPRVVPRGRSMPGNEERMRRHLSDMERLMEHMRSELEALEEP